jgi:phage gp29-like protein
MESKGGAKYDTESIIRRLQGDILSALSVDILKLGADGTGSFSLAESKSSVLAIAIDYRLREIAEVLNHDLMRTLYEVNGWEVDNLPKFVYADIEEVSLEDFSKAIQRIFSTSAIEVDRGVMNRVREVLKMPLLPDDEPVDKEKLPAKMADVQSNAGAGMAVGTTGNGTAKNGNAGSGNASDNKSDNSA